MRILQESRCLTPVDPPRFTRSGHRILAALCVRLGRDSTKANFPGYLILETCHQNYPRLCRFLLERPCDRLAQTLPAMNQVSRQVVVADLLGKHVMDRDQDLVGNRPPPES